MNDILEDLFSNDLSTAILKLARHLENYETQLTHPKFDQDALRKTALWRDLQTDIDTLKNAYTEF